MAKSDFLFLLVLASIPIQLGRHFFFPYSYVLGLPIDYRALTIYVSDIFVILYLAAFFWENRTKIKSIYKSYKTIINIIAAFNAYLFISSLLFSLSGQASLVFVAKIIIFSLLGIASAVSFSRKTTLKPGILILKIAMVLESLVLLAQFILQRSIGLGILGERTFDTTTPSIAHVELFGNQLLRPYGTFPHPNVAAAFLVFGLILLLGSNRIKKPKLDQMALLFAAAGLIATFSKSAFAAIAVALGIIFAKKKVFLILVLALLAIGILILKNTSDSSLPTISERMVLIQKSLDISLLNPAFGVGANNFILELSKANLFSVSQIRLLQPVHNIFFLILAENGIIGLLLFTALLFVVLKSVNTKTKLALFVSILIFGSVDHFLWTLQQGQLLLWLSIGYILSSSPFIARSEATK
ncbi:MAG: O-antigen ligase family protein [Candidatus Curtissbacteria bacterium]|nr:O-antigen ligase family protein [Candidatus Curtissbacteria bacterium]